MTWILNAVLYTQNFKRDVFRGHILIQDGIIVEIRKTLPSRFAQGSKVIDASGLTILPGFIQAHIHLCQTLFRNCADDLELLDWLSQKIWKMEAAHTAETLAVSAKLGIYELLSSGTTCILDMATVRHTEAILKTVLKTGIRANVGKCLMDHPNHTPENLRENTDTALKEALQLFKKWNGQANDRIRFSFAPRFVLSCTEKLLKKVAELSSKNGALIHTHASENPSEVEWVRKITGRDNIHYFDHLGLLSKRTVLAHCVWLKDGELDRIHQTQSHIVHCPSSNLKLASGFAQIPEIRAKGVNVALGADGAPCNNRLDAFTEMRLAALIHKPGRGPKTLRAPEIIDLMTLGGAQALQWSDQIGSIEVGKKADLVALNLNTPENLVENELEIESIASSIVYSSDPRHVVWTRVDGKCLYSNGKVSGIDRKKLMKEIFNARKTIFSRLKNKK